MPIYLYECESCGVRFERMQRMSDPPLTDCPECDGHVHRVLQPVGIIFKGSGFYVTDHRQGSSSTLAPGKESPSGSKPMTETESSKEASTTATSTASDPGE